MSHNYSVRILLLLSQRGLNPAALECIPVVEWAPGLSQDITIKMVKQGVVKLLLRPSCGTVALSEYKSVDCIPKDFFANEN